MIEAPLVSEPPERIGAEVASVVADDTLWYTLLGEEHFIFAMTAVLVTGLGIT